MTRSLLASLALSTSLLAASGAAVAQPADTYPAAPAPAPERVHSINVSPLGLLDGGGFNLNYERLFGSHGLILEVGTTEWSSTSRTTINGDVTDETSIDARHATLGVGYRWHWRGRQNSGFLGVMLHQNLGAADVVLMDGDGRVEDEVAYRSTTFTGNVGKRWMIGDALNVTLRLGVGTADRQVIDDDADEMAAAELQDVIGIPLAVDGELSLGYTF